jgi:hypothetical protein
MAVWPYSTARWKRLRLAKLRSDPLCEYCPDGVATPANEVDHKSPINQGGAPFDMDNLASTCSACHRGWKQSQDYEAARAQRRGYRIAVGADGWPEDPRHPANTGGLIRRFGYSIPDNMQPPGCPAVVVCGPPGSGKTTWARDNAAPGDLIIDLDDILEQVGGRRWDDRKWMLKKALAKRDAILRGLCSRTSGTAYVIVGAPTSDERAKWSEALGGAAVVLLDVPEAECRRRLEAERGDKAKDLSAAVSRWWARYTPDASQLALPSSRRASRV